MTEIQTKRCYGCGLEKSRKEFHAHANSIDGLKPRCKECRKVDTANYRAKYPERIKASRLKRNQEEYYRNKTRIRRGSLRSQEENALGNKCAGCGKRAEELPPYHKSAHTHFGVHHRYGNNYKLKETCNERYRFLCDNGQEAYREKYKLLCRACHRKEHATAIEKVSSLDIEVLENKIRELEAELVRRKRSHKSAIKSLERQDVLPF